MKPGHVPTYCSSASVFRNLCKVQKGTVLGETHALGSNALLFPTCQDMLLIPETSLFWLNNNLCSVTVWWLGDPSFVAAHKHTAGLLVFGRIALL